METQLTESEIRLKTKSWVQMHDDREWENQSLVLKYDLTKEDAVILNHNTCINTILCLDEDKDLSKGYFKDSLSKKQIEVVDNILDSCKLVLKDDFSISVNEMKVEDDNVTYYCHFLGFEIARFFLICKVILEDFQYFWLCLEIPNIELNENKIC